MELSIVRLQTEVAEKSFLINTMIYYCFQMMYNRTITTTSKPLTQPKL